MGIFNFFGNSLAGKGKKVNTDFVYMGKEKKLPSSMDVNPVEDINDMIPTGGSIDYTAYMYAANKTYENILNYRFLYRDSYEVFFAVNEIINEAVVVSNNTKDEVIEIDLTNLKVHDVIKDAFRKSFENIKYLINWKQNSQAIFRKWYIDGRKYFYPIVPNEFPTSGIVEIKMLSPFYVSAYYDEDTEMEEEGKHINGFKKMWKLRDYQGVVYDIEDDVFVCVDSGYYDPETGEAISYLSLAEKHFNRLDLIENSLVIYRVVRAPERRVFTVQIRKNARNKVKEQMRDLMRAYSNSAIFDSNMKRMDSKKAFMSMTSDLWVTEDSDGKGTKVDTLAGGTNVGEVTDVEYLKKNLIRALNIPLSSYFDQGGFNFSLGSQITEEKKRFFDFISSLHNQFNNLWYDLMEIDLVCKRVVTTEEWNQIKQDINFKWTSSSYFNELKELEAFNVKLDAIDRIDQYVGKYFDDMFIYRDVLGWNDEKINDMKKRLDAYNKVKKDENSEGGSEGSNFGGMDNGPDMNQFPSDEDLGLNAEEEAGGEEEAGEEESSGETLAVPEES